MPASINSAHLKSPKRSFRNLSSLTTEYAALRHSSVPTRRELRRDSEKGKSMANLNFCAISLAAALLLLAIPSTIVSAKKSGDVTELQIGVKYKPKSCDIQAHKGDTIKVHYRGKLTDGTVFDSSFERGDPIEFQLGSGQVIKGWDQGLLGMCVGEKRKLKIPAKLGYGEQGSPPTIPGGATLVFDTELVAVNGKNSGREEVVADDEDEL